METEYMKQDLAEVKNDIKNIMKDILLLKESQGRFELLNYQTKTELSNLIREAVADGIKQFQTDLSEINKRVEKLENSEKEKAFIKIQEQDQIKKDNRKQFRNTFIAAIAGFVSSLLINNIVEAIMIFLKK